MHSKSEKTKAIMLRRQGYSYRYISEQISVAKSTLSLWLKTIPFIPNEMTKALIATGQRKAIDIKRSDKAASWKIALDYARNSVSSLSERDIYLLGIGIYIGEGSKSGNYIRVSNADPRIIKFSVLWFKRCFGLSNSNFRVRVHIYPDNDPKEVLEFWVKELGLSKNNFHPVYIDRRLDKKPKKRSILPYGTAHLSVVSNGDKNLGVLLHRKILASIDHVLL